MSRGEGRRVMRVWGKFPSFIALRARVTDRERESETSLEERGVGVSVRASIFSQGVCRVSSVRL